MTPFDFQFVARAEKEYDEFLQHLEDLYTGSTYTHNEFLQGLTQLFGTAIAEDWETISDDGPEASEE